MIMSAKLVDWFVNRAISQLPQVSGRGTKRQDFDASEIAAIHRMLVGYFNTSELGWDECLRSKDVSATLCKAIRSGASARSGSITFGNRSLFLEPMCISCSKSLLKALVRWLQIPHQTGTAELALDDSFAIETQPNTQRTNATTQTWSAIAWPVQSTPQMFEELRWFKVLADEMRVEYNRSCSRADAIREVHKRSCTNPTQLNVAPEIEATECPTQSSNSLEA
jgi:hypothetical protein